MKIWHWIVVLFIAFMALFPFDFGRYDQAMNRTLDAGHFLAFGLLSYILFQWALRRNRVKPLLFSALSCFGIILLVEFVQPAMGRSATLQDVWNSVAGVLVVLAWLHLRRAKKRRRLLTYGHYSLASLLFLVASFPAINGWYAEWWRMENFPVLGRFEQSVELVLWQARGETEDGATLVSLSRDYAAEGRQSLRVETTSGDWSGVKYVVERQDWRGYNRIVFSVFNPGEPFTLEFRVDDDRPNPKHSERFSQYLSVARGENRFEFTLDKIKHSTREGVLNIGAITKVILVCEREDPPRLFFLDGVKLVKSSQP